MSYFDHLNDFEVDGDVKGSGQGHFLTTTLAPLVVASSMLVVGFNADLFEGQHGAFYLDAQNLTNKYTTLAGWGITDAYTKTEVDAKLLLKYDKPSGGITDYIRGDGSIAAFPTIPTNRWGSDYTLSTTANTAGEDLNTALPNGGYLHSYFSATWATNGPAWRGFGGWIKFHGLTSNPSGLELFFNNGHGGGADRFGYRTYYSASGVKTYNPWREFWTDKHFSQTEVNAWNDAPRRGVLGGAINSVRVLDTRSVNPLPSTNLTYGAWFDFKENTAIGLTAAGTYSATITMAPYSGDSGNNNAAFRLAQSLGGMYFQNYKAGAWEGWQHMWSSPQGQKLVLTAPSSGQFVRFNGANWVNSTLTLAKSDFYPAFGANVTTGVLDWNDVTNTMPGSTPTLLQGSASNGPGGGTYFHPFNFEYNTKNGTGNLTQLAIPYNGTAQSLWFRSRFSGVWTDWYRNLNSVNTVGTANRLTVTHSGTNSFFDISAAYVGQASITTLGTITTGVWNATTIAIAKGGTGLTAVGTSGQLLRSNGTGLEYFTPNYVLTSLVGAANGIATLDASGKVPLSQLPTTGMQYMGTWDASTNTPTLSNGTGTNGHWYRAISGGTVDFGSGPVTFVTGDAAIYNGTIWQKDPAGAASTNLAIGTITGTSIQITNSNGTGFTLTAATTSQPGLLSAADKAKIDSAITAIPTLDQVLAAGNTSGSKIQLQTNDENGTGFSATSTGLFAASLYANPSGSFIFFADNVGFWGLGYEGGGFGIMSGALRVTLDPVHADDLSRKGYVDAGLATKYNIPAGTTAQYIRGDGSLATFPTIPTVVPSALTKTDDTNITITLGGSPGSALLQAVSITAGWAGTLSVARGGSGAATLAGVLVGSGTSPFTGVTGTAGQLLRRNAGDTAYEFFTPTYITGNQNITLSGDVTGSGTTAISTTIAAGAVTLAKMANLAANSIIGNNTAAPATPLALSAAQVRALLNVANGATANQTDAYLLSRANHTGTQAISTITGLQAALDSKFTTPAGTVSQYVRGDGSLAVFPAIGNGTLTFSPGPGISVGGTFSANQSANTTVAIALDASLSDIDNVTVTSPITGQLLRFDGTNWTNWTPNYLTSFTESDPTVPSHVKAITAGNIADWNSKQAAISIATARLMGRYAAGTGTFQEISLGSGLSLSGTGVLTATGSGGSVTSVGMTVPTGFTVSPAAITTSGVFALAYATGYEGYTSVEKTKLAGIAAGATANQTDAYLLNRANHTGAQAISTVTGLQAALDAKGTVNQVSAGTGLVGGTITNIGTIAFDNTYGDARYATKSGNNYINGGWNYFRPTADYTVPAGTSGFLMSGTDPVFRGYRAGAVSFELRTFGFEGAQLVLIDGGISAPASAYASGGYSYLVRNNTSGNFETRNIQIADVSGLQAQLDGKFGTPGGTASQYVRGDGSLAVFPAIGNGTLTFSPGPGISVGGTFSANQSTNTTVAIALDATLSDIDNVTVSSPITGQLLRFDGTNWTNWTPNYLTSFTESDPTVPAHVKAITAGNISTWNAKQDAISIATARLMGRYAAGTGAFQEISLGANLTLSGAGVLSATSSGGSVTSVGLAAPTGFTVSGSPVTGSGTLTFAYATGYEAYTSAEKTKLASITPANYVNTTGDQSGIAGVKGWTGAHYWGHSATFTPSAENTATNSSILIGGAGGTPYIVGRDANSNAFTLRTAAPTGYQLTLNKGSIEMTPDGTGIDFYGGASIYKRVGGGLTLKRNSDAREITISNAAGSAFYRIFNEDWSLWRGRTSEWITGDINDIGFNGGLYFAAASGITNTPENSNSYILHMPHYNNGSVWMQLGVPYGNNSKIYVRQNNAGTIRPWTALAYESWADAKFALISHSHTFASLTEKPTTLAGYGITDAASLTNVVTIAGAQNVTGSKTWTGLHTWTPTANNFSTNSSIMFGASAGPRPYIVGRDVDSEAFVLRTESVSGFQLSLLKGGISTPNHGNSSQWNTAYGWGNHASAGYVPSTRGLSFTSGSSAGLTVSGTALADLSANRTVTYTLNFGSGSGQVAQGNDSRINNGQTAYSWGNHASYGYITGGRHVSTSGSLQGGGDLYSDRTLSLVGDSGSPGANRYYGTNGSGSKGFWNLPTGGGITGNGTAFYVPIWNSSSNLTYADLRITGGGNFIVGGTSYSSDHKMTVNNGLLVSSGGFSGSSASAVLELSSTTQGFLPPRMNTTDWNNISSKASGLIAYNSVEHAIMWYTPWGTGMLRFTGSKYQVWVNPNWVDIS